MRSNLEAALICRSRLPAHSDMERLGFIVSLVVVVVVVVVYKTGKHCTAITMFAFVQTASPIVSSER